VDVIGVREPSGTIDTQRTRSAPGRGVTDMDLDDRITRPIPNHPPRMGCLVEGCPCKDPLILSHRRARFYAHLARINGETACRMIPPEPGWELPRAG
jgi:hypothetical protein